MAKQDSNPIPQRVQNLIGNVYGRLTVVGYAEERNKRHHWFCRCSCGKTKTINGQSLVRGLTKSCGCYQKEIASDIGKRNLTHGMTDTPEYNTWRTMIDRCENPNNDNYRRYGKRGITVCERWRKSFEAFLADMGKRPTTSHTIDRINSNGNYEPQNCQWATPMEQSNNRRTNRPITFQGQTKTISQWAREFGLKPDMLFSRLDKLGWSVEDALLTPPQD